jgi:hypothetical protein
LGRRWRKRIRRSGPQRLCGQHVLGALEHQDLPAYQPRHRGPPHHANHDEDDRQRRVHRRSHRDQEEQRGKSQGHVGQAHDQPVHPPAVVAGDEAEGDAEETGDDLADDADRERDPGAVDDAGQYVPALGVSASGCARLGGRR